MRALFAVGLSRRCPATFRSRSPLGCPTDGKSSARSRGKLGLRTGVSLEDWDYYHIYAGFARVVLEIIDYSLLSKRSFAARLAVDFPQLGGKLGSRDWCFT